MVVGPDGAGKSTVVDAIAERAAASGVRLWRAHYRPGLFTGSSDGVPSTDPHAAPPRSAPAALAKLGLVLGDHLLGYLVRWRQQRRDGLLLLERGWFDMTVDPRRYRLPEHWAPAVRLIGRVLPRPDVVLVLSGDPQALHDRKPEIGVEEVERQIRSWRDVAPDAGTQVLEVDTVDATPEQVASTLSAALAKRVATKPWRAVPFTPSRIELRACGRAHAALAMYQPQSLRARAGTAVAYRAVRIPGARVPSPFPHLGDLWRLLGLCPDGLAAMQSSTPGRLLISVSQRGQMIAVVKGGALHDATLRHEAAMLAIPLPSGSPIVRPQVLWSGEWNGNFVLVTRAEQRRGRAAWSPHEVLPLVEALATAGPGGGPVTHGDLVPWNLLRTARGAVLLDWESARFADEPLYDLAHFVVQGGALLGRYGPDDAVALLCDRGSPGWSLLRARGRDVAEARPLLADYLAQSRPNEPRAVRFRTEMLRLVPT